MQLRGPCKQLQQSPGVEPLVRRVGAKPLEAETLLTFDV